jgi:hypothetical protein
MVQKDGNDQRPINALKAAHEWLSGAIKLPQAKSALLEYPLFPEIKARITEVVR